MQSVEAVHRPSPEYTKALIKINNVCAIHYLQHVGSKNHYPVECMYVSSACQFLLPMYSMFIISVIHSFTLCDIAKPHYKIWEYCNDNTSALNCVLNDCKV